MSAQHGWLEMTGLKRLPSPNFDQRPSAGLIDLLVIHNISLPPGQYGQGYATDLFLNRLNIALHPWFEHVRGLRVSPHFLIERDGTMTQFVSCQDRAWHAGVSHFLGRERCNDFSIGVELEGTDHEPFTEAQYSALAILSQSLRKRYPLAHVRGHSDIAPERKTDPGPCFDWLRYAKEAGWQLHELPTRFEPQNSRKD